MIKEIIFFDDVDLYGRCEVHAKRNGLLKGSDFIVFSVEKYFTQQGQQVYWKKPIDMWLSCEPEARKAGVTISEFIEGICKVAIDGLAPKDTAATNKKTTVWAKISDMMSLPKG
jgi:protein involved in sex pheromone biosynthesis